MGILVAIAAIADPVQRISFRLTLPWYVLTWGLHPLARPHLSSGGDQPQASKLLRQRWEGWPVAADLAIVYILACVTVESYGVVQDD